MVCLSPFRTKETFMILISMLCAALGVQESGPSVKDALAEFKKAYKTSDAALRAAAVESLGKVEHPKVLKPLLMVLTKDTPELRIKVAELLGKWSLYSDRAAAVLRTALKPNDKDVKVHAALVKALGDLKELLALKDIEARLDHVHVDISVAAIEAAGKLKSPLFLEKLIGMVETIDNIRNQPPRLGGGGIDATRSSPELQAKRRAQYPLLMATLTEITGQKFKDGKAAREWWKANRRSFGRG